MKNILNEIVQSMPFFVGIAILVAVIITIVNSVKKKRKYKKEQREYKQLRADVFNTIGLTDNLLNSINNTVNNTVIVNSRKKFNDYDVTAYFKEDRQRLTDVSQVLKTEQEWIRKIHTFMLNNSYQDHPQYQKVAELLERLVGLLSNYTVRVSYISSAGNYLDENIIRIHLSDIAAFENDPTLLMEKSEYKKWVKEKEKQDLKEKQDKYYAIINKVIDFADNYRNSFVCSNDREEFDKLVCRLYTDVVANIKKIKLMDSNEWVTIEAIIESIKKRMKSLVEENQRILKYYKSQDFQNIKTACSRLMQSQKDFNEYVQSKADSVSRLLGTKIVRNETQYSDVYEYVHPYKKEASPFTAEVSAAVFSSAENNPLEYVVKYFYPVKADYPKQIQNLRQLIGEIETLQEAQDIINRQKQLCRQYITNVPESIITKDESGFFARLGFAEIQEKCLKLEYKFSYTSGVGLSQRSFVVPINEETITDIIKILESKLTNSAFVKEQRGLMTKKLREEIKERDNHTCCICGNSTRKEPNLLLEIDHIIPVSKGGTTVKSNLQTLCWRCNRIKSDKCC